MREGFLDYILLTTVRALPPALCAMGPNAARAETMISITVDLEREDAWRAAIDALREALRDPPVQYFALPIAAGVEVSKLMHSRSQHQAVRLTRQFVPARYAVITTLDVAVSRR